MSIEQMDKLIADNADPADFVGECQENQVAEVEQLLGVKLPKSYRHFLLKYGSGGLGAEEFCGITRSNKHAGHPDVVFNTESLRQYELPKHMVVVWNCGADEAYVIDTSQMKDGEAPIIEWIGGLPASKQSLKPVYGTFAEFFVERVRNEIEE